MGELDRAQAIRQRLYGSLEELNAPQEWVWNCFEDGEIYRIRGNYDKAQERYETAWQRANQLANRTGFASYHHALGMLAYHREEYAKAQEYFSVGFNYIITHPRAGALSWYSARDGMMLSLVGVCLGDIALAKSYFEQGLTHVYRVPNSGLRGLAAVVKAEIELAEGNLEAAVAILKYAQQYRPMWYETKQELQQLWDKLVATYGVERVEAVPSIPAETDIKEILNKSWE
jgi:tetratricopeptide (TPR) repeat protein